VSQIRFFKVPSKGKFQDIDTSVDALHARRVVVIEDKPSSTYWIIAGKNASANAIKNADQQVKKLIKGATSKMKSSKVEYDQAADHLHTILNRPRQKQASKIPLVPNSASEVLRRNRVKSSEGPVIKEFEIAYYKDESTEMTSGITEEIESLLSKYSDEIHQEYLHRTTKTKTRKKLNRITSQLIELIYT